MMVWFRVWLVMRYVLLRCYGILLFYWNIRQNKNVIIGIWDFAEQGYSTLGDHTIFLESINLLRHELGEHTQVKILYINDLNRIQRLNKYYQSVRFNKAETTKKLIISLSKLIPQAETLTFNHKDGIKKYSSLFNEEHNILYYPDKRGICPAVHYGIIKRYYKKYNRIEPLYTHPIYQVMPWGHDYIVIQLRNSTKMPERNTPIEEIQKIIAAFPKERFVIICSEEEILPSLRAHNVFYSKDYFTTIQDDYALMQGAKLNILPNSGMCTIAWFNGLPTIHYGYKKKYVFRSTQTNKRHKWLSKNQEIHFRQLEGSWIIPRIKTYLEKEE